MVTRGFKSLTKAFKMFVFSFLEQLQHLFGLLIRCGLKYYEQTLFTINFYLRSHPLWS